MAGSEGLPQVSHDFRQLEVTRPHSSRAPQQLLVKIVAVGLLEVGALALSAESAQLQNSQTKAFSFTLFTLEPDSGFEPVVPEALAVADEHVQEMLPGAQDDQTSDVPVKRRFWQTYQRIVTAIAAAELAHSVGGHLAWLAHHLRDLSLETQNALAKEYGALLAMFKRPPGPQQTAVLEWARPIIAQSQTDFPLYLIKAHLEQHLLLAWRFTDSRAALLLQAVSEAVLQTDAIMLEWVACFLDERIATDILEHLDDETMHLLEDSAQEDCDSEL